MWDFKILWRFVSFFSVHFNVVAYMLFDITKILQNYCCQCWIWNFTVSAVILQLGNEGKEVIKMKMIIVYLYQFVKIYFFLKTWWCVFFKLWVLVMTLFLLFLNILSWEDFGYLSHYIGLTSQVLAKPQDKDS